MTQLDPGLKQAIGSLEYQMLEWKRRMEAAQNLKRFYKGSTFAETTIAKKEKEFKKKYWQAYYEYEKFKKVVLGIL